MGSPTAAATASAGSVPDVKTTEDVFEIKAVGKQARGVLEVVNDIRGQLDAARTLRKQTSRLLSATEKRLIDNTFEITERALTDAATPAEPCGVAKTTTDDDIEEGSEPVSALRDFPQTPIGMSRLVLASQRVQTALSILCSRDNLQHFPTLQDPKPPPTYEESQFLTESRTRNMLRRASSNTPLVNDESRHDRHPRSTLERLAETTEFADSGSVLDPSKYPQSERAELFFDVTEVQSPQHSPPQRYIPYRPGRTSVSMTSLDSRASTPRMPIFTAPSSDSGTPGDFYGDSVGPWGLSHPDLAPDQLSEGMRLEVLRQSSQSPTVSVVDGFAETQQRMDAHPLVERAHQALYRNSGRPQLDSYGISSTPISGQEVYEMGTSSSRRIEKTFPQPLWVELAQSNSQSAPKIWSRHSAPAIPTTVPLGDSIPSRPPSRPPPAPPTPVSIPMLTADAAKVDVTTALSSQQLQLPQHIVTHEPVLSAQDLAFPSDASLPQDKGGPEIVEKQPQNKKDWETLPSQARRESANPAFVSESPQPGHTPKPLLHSSAKLHANDTSTEVAHKVPIGVTTEVIPAASAEAPQPSLESEFPEVVREAISMTICPVYPGSQLPGAVPRMLRQRADRRRSRACEAPELALPDVTESLPTQDQEEPVSKVRKSKVPPPLPPRYRKRPLSAPLNSRETVAALAAPDMPPHLPPRHQFDSQFESESPQPSVSAVAALPIPLVRLKSSSEVTGLARSRRWRELQFARSQFLPSSSS